MRIQMLFSALLVFSMYISSCSIFSPRESELLNIKPPLNVSIHQLFSPTGEELALYLDTGYISPYKGEEIEVRLRVQSGTISLEIKGIRPHEDPWNHPGFAPANTLVELGWVASGTYRFLVDIGDTLIVSSLTVTDDSYSIVGLQSKWLTLNQSSVGRLPVNTMWGRIILHKEAPGGDAVVQSFLDSLAVLGAEQFSLSPGFYGYFRGDERFVWECFNVDSTGTNSTCISILHNCTNYFRRFTGETDPLRELVRRYSQRYHLDYILDIGLMRTTGEGFYSAELIGAPR